MKKHSKGLKQQYYDKGKVNKGPGFTVGCSCCQSSLTKAECRRLVRRVEKVKVKKEFNEEVIDD